MDVMKRGLRKLLSGGGVPVLWSALTRARVTIFTLHRFAWPDHNVAGHDPDLLRTTFERLRRDRYAVLSLGEAVERHRERRDFPPRAVVFTVDDGYADFFAVGAPVFAHFDAPVTVFLTTGFIDGTHWHWWDEIAYAAVTSPRDRVEVRINGATRVVALGNETERRRAAHELAVRSTFFEEAEKRRIVADFARAAEVAIPVVPPPRYAGMKWSEVRALAGEGVSFGPHTVTHPILVRTAAAQAEHEIAESWHVLRRELPSALPIFAYPNGDFGAREIAILERAGIEAAVTTEPAYAATPAFHDPAVGPFRVPRFSYPESPDEVCLRASGFDRIMQGLKRLARGGPAA